MSRTPRHEFAAEAKAADGAIVQFVSTTGERRTVAVDGITGIVRDKRGKLVLHGGTETALRRAITAMEQWPGVWKVEVISTPSTILRDLQGTRVTPTKGSGAAASVHTPEPIMLARIGRSDLLAR